MLELEEEEARVAEEEEPAVVGRGLAESVRARDCVCLGCIMAKCRLESCWRT